MPIHDVIVIGAGAAGLAATRTLIDLGHKAIILEARGRIGGRAWTENASFGVPIDRGCGWLHSADENPWRKIARDLGIAVLEENPVWQSRIGDRWMGEGDSAHWDDAISGWFDSIAAAGAAGRDVPASSVIGDGRFRTLFDAIVTWACGVESRELSTLDYSRYRDTGNDWPVPDGYGALVARYGAGLPVRLNTPATLVRWSGKDIAVETPAGTLTSGAVIVTLPPSVLQAGGLRFDPPLPPAKQEAIAGIKVGTANKVFIALDGDPFGMPDTSYGTSSADRRRVASLSFKPFGRSMVGGYLGGDLAEELELAGGDAMIDFVIGEFVGMFGGGIRGHLGKAIATSWFTDPWSRGAYSAARPGNAGARGVLAEPVDGRLYFAGEACSIDSFGTCHGAYRTGIHAGHSAATARLQR
jgi:monoamine oxidase